MHVAASQSIWCFICKWCSAMWLLTSPFLVAGLRSVSRVLRFLCRCRPSCTVLLFILAGKTTQYVYIILDSFSCQYEKQYSTRWKATAKNWKQVVHKEINIEHRLAERVWCLNPSPYLWMFTFNWVQRRVQLLDPDRLLLLRSTPKVAETYPICDDSLYNIGEPLQKSRRKYHSYVRTGAFPICIVFVSAQELCGL